MDQYTFTTQLWEHDGPAAWCFLDLPHDDADDIEARTAPDSTGFGSVRVEVTVGATTWRTSLFPDTRRGTYVLPVRKPVRQAEGLVPGDDVQVCLRLVEHGPTGRSSRRRPAARRR